MNNLKELIYVAAPYSHSNPDVLKFEKLETKKKRKAALSKLTPEEIKLLGIENA